MRRPALRLTVNTSSGWWCADDRIRVVYNRPPRTGVASSLRTTTPFATVVVAAMSTLLALQKVASYTVVHRPYLCRGTRTVSTTTTGSCCLLGGLANSSRKRKSSLTVKNELHRPFASSSSSNHTIRYHVPHASPHQQKNDEDVTVVVPLVHYTRTQVRRMKKAQLIKELDIRRMDTNGTRIDLLNRLLMRVDDETLPKTRVATNGKQLPHDVPSATTANRTEKTAIHDKTTALNVGLLETPPPAVDDSSRPALHEAAPTSQDSPVLADSSSDDEDYFDDSSSSDDEYYYDDNLPIAAAAQLEDVGNTSNIDHNSSRLLDSDRTYVLRIKGYSRPNWGTGVGIVLCDVDADDSDEVVVWTARKFLPGARNTTVSAYCALVLGLRYASRLGAKRLVVETDQYVVGKQLLGIYEVEDSKTVKPVYLQVMKMIKTELDSFEVRIVDKNEEASDLAKKAMATGKSVNMSDESAPDPMGEDFTGFGQQIDVGPVIGCNEMSTIDPSRTYRLQFDGGSRGNPTGKSGCGMVLYDDDEKEIWCGWKFLDPMSNNRAEYNALLLGLLCARSLGITKLRAQGDSALVVRQMLGQYKVYSPVLRQLREQSRSVANEFDEFDISFIYRVRNRRADWLANHAMDSETSYGFDET